MRAAVITDIHSNLPALEAVLAAIDEIDVEEVWCLGDVVGYGAEPDQCTEIVGDRCDTCLVGNHDLAVLGELDVSAFPGHSKDLGLETVSIRQYDHVPLFRFLMLVTAGSDEGR